MISIRDMTVDDAQVVSGIYANSWRKTYKALMSPEALEAEIAKRFSPELQASEAENPDILTIVAVEDDTIVGVSSASMDARHQAWIDRMHVVPKHQGKGVSERLLTATLAKHSGLQSIALKVLEGNKRAIGFYKKHGFSKTDVIKDDPNVGGATTVIMSRTLPRG